MFPKSKNIVCFLHGKKTGPDCEQIKRLVGVAACRGFETYSADFTATVDPDERIEMLRGLNPQADENLVLVGFSMGGYAAVVASDRIKPQGLFLCSAAFYLPNYTHQDPTPHADFITLVHGWQDTVVPVENAFRFAQKHRTTLHVLNTDHLSLGALEKIAALFVVFLDRVLGK